MHGTTDSHPDTCAADFRASCDDGAHEVAAHDGIWHGMIVWHLVVSRVQRNGRNLDDDIVGLSDLRHGPVSRDQRRASTIGRLNKSCDCCSFGHFRDFAVEVYHLLTSKTTVYKLPSFIAIILHVYHGISNSALLCRVLDRLPDISKADALVFRRIGSAYRPLFGYK